MSISDALRAPSKRESNEDDEYSGENKHEAAVPVLAGQGGEENSCVFLLLVKKKLADGRTETLCIASFNDLLNAPPACKRGFSSPS